jgi:hypothetical protein
MVNRPEGWAAVDKGGREGGATWIKLCQEYADSLKAPPTPAADPVSTVKAWMDAMNAGEVDAALAPFTDDAPVTGVLQATGKEALRGAFGYVIGMENRFGVPDCDPVGAGLVCTFTVADSCIAGFGATDGLGVKGTFDIQQDGKIRKAQLMSDGEGWAEYALWDVKFKAWARTNRAEEVAKYTYETFTGAPILAKLCKEYAETLK